MRIEGFVSRRIIRFWLDNYQAIAAHDLVLDALPKNSSAKPYDGIANSQMNKVMLDDAIKKLPPRIGACAVARWIKRWDTRQILKTLNISREVYYERCDDAIELIYQRLNGSAINYGKLMDEIKKGL